MPFPPLDKSMGGVLKDTRERLDLVERRLATGGSGATVAQATETAAGIAEIATQAEVTTGTDDARFVTPLKLAQRIAAIPPGSVADATETVKGVAEIATTAEATTGTDHTRMVTPLGLKTVADTKAPLSHTHTMSQISDAATVVPTLVPAATETTQGKAEIATQAEVTTGTDDARFVTPLKLAQRLVGIGAVPAATESVAGIAEIATTAEVTTGTDDARIVTPLKLKGVADTKAPTVHTHTSSQITDWATAVPAAVPQATETVPGKAEVATQAEVTTATDDARMVTPLKLAQRLAAGGLSPVQATETVVGGAEIATAAEATTGTDHTRIITPLTLKQIADTKAATVHTHTSSQITDWATAVPAAVPAATETVAGKAEVATQAEVTAATDDTRMVTPLKLAQRIAAIPAVAVASETVQGIVELATAAETTAGTDSTRAVHPAGLKVELDKKSPTGHTHTSSQISDFATAVPAAVPQATESVAGKAEIATAAEVTAATDDARIVTPLKLQQRIAAIPAVASASETVQGIVELATAAETTTGTDAVRAVHPQGLKAVTNTLISKTLIDAKGDVIVGTANDVPARLPVGGNGMLLTADSAEPSGVKWAPPVTTGETPYDALAGMIVPYAGTFAPDGWLFCDGSAVSRTTFSKLFAVVGTFYGAGDGSTTFNVPNLKGRVPVGWDPAQPEFDGMGDTGGEKAHTLTIGEMPSHSHEVNYLATGTVGSSAWQVGTNANKTGTTTGVSAGGGGAHENMPPYQVANYIISTGNALGGGGEAPVIPPLPDPVSLVGPQTNSISQAAATWADIPGLSVTIDAPSPMWVMCEMGGELSTPNVASYAMVGVAASGALNLSPEVDQATGNISAFGYTPYSATTATAVPAGGHKMLLLPKGVTTLKMQMRRNTTTAVAVVSYPVFIVTPTAWAGQPGTVAGGSPVRNLGRVRLATSSTQGGISTVQNVTGMAVTVALALAADLRIHGVLNHYGSASVVMTMRLLDNGVAVAEWTVPANSHPTTANTTLSTPFSVEFDDVPTGTHTYQMAVLLVVGSGTITVQSAPVLANWLSVDQIG